MQTQNKARIKKLLIVGSALIGLCLSVYGGLVFSNSASDKPAVGEKQEVNIVPIQFDIPYLSGINIDGDGTDWQDQGFYVPKLEASRFTLEDATLNGSAKIAWCDKGILLYAEITEPQYARVTDRSILNASEFSMQFKHKGNSESVALKKLGYAITIRRAGDEDERILIYDRRPADVQKSEPLEPLIQTRRTDKGYIVEALLPTHAADLIAEENTLAQFNIDASISDGTRHESVQLWHFMNPQCPHPELRFAKTSSPPILSYAVCDIALEKQEKSYSEVVAEYHERGETVADMLDDGYNYETLRQSIRERRFCKISLEPSSRIKGKTMYVKDPNGKVLAQAPYNSNGLTIAEVEAEDDSFLQMNYAVYVDDTAITRVAPFHQNYRSGGPSDRPDRLYMDTYIFAGTDFPEGQLADPILSKQALGTYTLKTTFYDKDMNPVKHATKPGRYGALSVVETGEGKYFRVYSTLLRDDELASDIPDIQGPSLPRVQDEEIIAIEQLALREATAKDRMFPTNATDEQYFTFDHNQKWWLDLREMLNIRFPWVVTLPPDYSDESDKKWPVVVYFHGGGAQDIEDLDANILEQDFTQIVQGGEGPFGDKSVTSDPNYKPRKLPVIVLQPQLSVGDLRWTGSIMHLVLRQAARDYNIDEDRVIITGHCGGAGGAYRVASYAPELFAGFIPLTIGRYGMDGAYRLKHVPTWAFTGADDTDPIPVHTENLVNAINATGGNAKISILEGVGHNTEGPVWTRDDVWEWVLAQRRHKPIVTAADIPRPNQDAGIRQTNYESK